MLYRRILLLSSFLLAVQLAVQAEAPWIPRPPDLMGVVSTGNGFLAVGNQGTIVSSENGTDWVDHPVDTTNTLTAVAAGKGVFVAVGEAGTILVSSNSLNWTPRTSGATGSLASIAFGADKFLAVGQGGIILSSQDGNNWSPVASGTGQYLAGVTFGGGKFVIVGESGTILTSPDGNSFQLQASPTSNALYTVGFGGGLYVAVGDAPGPFAAVITSPDAATWTLRSTPARNALLTVAYQNGTFVAGGFFGYLQTSPNGIDWTQKIVSPAYDGVFFSAAFSGSKGIAVGSSGATAVSDNLEDWKLSTGPLLYNGGHVAFGLNLFVEAGQNREGKGALASSPAGVLWKTENYVASNRFYSVAFGLGNFVAVGAAGEMASSTDGHSWVPRTSGVEKSFNGVYFVNGQFFALGEAGTILVSTNAVTWKPVELDFPDSLNSLNAITYGNVKYVMTGGGTIFLSTDGVNWNSVYQNNQFVFQGITFGNGRFVAVGANFFTAKGGGIVTSTDGANWTLISQDEYSPLNNIAYGDKFVAVGDSNTLLTSTNGTNFTLQAVQDVGPYLGVAYGSNGVWVVTGLFERALVQNSISGGTVGLPPTAGCVAPPAGLISWWRGEGNARDAVGNNDGTLLGNAAANRQGISGLGFVFDGQSAIQVADNPSLKPAHVSVEAWVLLRDLQNSNSTVPGLQYFLFKKNSRTANFEGYSLMKIVDTGGVHRFSFQTTSAAGVHAEANSTTPAVINKYFHLVGTFDGQKTSLYVNGKLESSVDSPFPLDYGNRPLFLGSSGETFFDGKLKGDLDEVSLYNRALSDTEAAALYAASAFGKCTNGLIVEPCSPTPSGVVGSWPGNGFGNDLAGTNTLTANAVTFGNGISGQAFRFNALSNSSLAFPDSPLLHSTSFTFEGWFNFSTLSNNQTLLYKGNGVGTLPATASYRLDYSQGVLFFSTIASDGFSQVSYPWIPVVGDWHHIAVTADSVTGQRHIYLNGRLVASKDFDNQEGNSSDLKYDAHPVYFGLGFTGRMDELAIYNRVLSQGEISRIVMAGGVGKCPPVPTKLFTISLSGTTDNFPPFPPDTDLVIEVKPPTPASPPVHAQVTLADVYTILKTTFGAAEGSTLDIIVGNLLDSRIITINAGGQLVVEGKIIGDVENVAGILSRDPTISAKIKDLGSLVKNNQMLIDAFGVNAVISIIKPEITRIFASFPSGGTTSGSVQKNAAGSVQKNAAGSVQKNAAGGGQVGAIQIDGDYTQDSEGILAIAIAGTNYVAGVNQEYDRLEVSGNATLSGQIGFGLLNASGGTDGAVFQPPVGAAFDVVVASQVTATNLVVRGPIWGGGLQFLPLIVQYDDGREGLRLLVTNVPPVLEIQKGPTGLQLVFPTNYLGQFVLEATTSLAIPDWKEIPGNSLPVPVANSGAARFLRLKKAP